MIELIPVQEKTASGVILSPMSNPRYGQVVEEFAKVVEVGPEVTITKPGDTVYFKEYNLDRIQTGDILSPTTIVFISQEHILAVA